jgi:hypothetical protein
LIPLSLERQQSRIVFEVGFRNNADARLGVHSLHPVRASWRFIETGEKSEKGADWNSRFQIERDILPHSVLNVSLSAELPGSVAIIDWRSLSSPSMGSGFMTRAPRSCNSSRSSR